VIRFECDDGGAELVETDGERVLVRAGRPSPPGSHFDMTLDGVAYRIKVRHCRRDGEGFLIDGRWVNLSRSMRERIGRS
jgi:hypothetical protein